MKNEVILDGKVQKDVIETDDNIVFVLSVISGRTEDDKTKYTRIKVIAQNNMSEIVRQTILVGGYVRVYGKLDCEKYIDKKNKPVYNKFLNAEKIFRIKYEGDKILEVS